MIAVKQMQVKNTIYNHVLAQQFPIHIIFRHLVWSRYSATIHNSAQFISGNLSSKNIHYLLLSSAN